MFDHYKDEWKHHKEEIFSLYERINKLLPVEKSNEVNKKFKELGVYLITEISEALRKENNKKVPHKSKMTNEKTTEFNVNTSEKTIKSYPSSTFKFNFSTKILEHEKIMIENDTNQKFIENIISDNQKIETLAEIGFVSILYYILYIIRIKKMKMIMTMNIKKKLI